MRTLLNVAIRTSIIPAIVVVGALVTIEKTSAEPNFTLDPASPSLGLIPAAPDDVLNPITGSPQWGGQPSPSAVFPGALLGLPPGAVMDDFSYGNEVPFAPVALAYSVNRGALGFPIGANALVAEAAAVEAAVGADLYTPAGPLLGGPCGLPPINPNVLLSDGDGTRGGAAPLRLGLGLDELPPAVFASQDNISGLELGNYAGSPVYFTVDGPTAGLLGVSPADVLAWFPFGPPVFVMWAPAGALGLVPPDDIDALMVGDTTPGDMVFTPGADFVFYSLKPGSPSLGLLPHCAPGPTSPGDAFFTIGGPPAPFVDAEMLGLATLRAGFVDDNLDAMDFVSVPAPMDSDGDGADNAIDFDDDNDQLSDSREAAAGCNPLVGDTDGDTLSDYTEVVVTGTNCTLVDTDGDNCNDGREPGPSHAAGGQRNPLDGYDFFDVPVPYSNVFTTVGMNKAVNGQDVLAVRTGTGHVAGDGIYNAQYDRQPSNTPGQPWRSRIGNGAISGQDVLTARDSTGDACP